MLYIKKYIDAGIQAIVVVVALLLLPCIRGIIPQTTISVDLTVFAATDIMVASDLPEIYA